MVGGEGRTWCYSKVSLCLNMSDFILMIRERLKDTFWYLKFEQFRSVLFETHSPL